jgi:hypothetical protein
VRTAVRSARRSACCGGASIATAASDGGTARRLRPRLRLTEAPACATVRRLFYCRHRDGPCLFVALAFLSLSFFIDFVDELADVGQRGYTSCMPRSIRCCWCRGTSTRSQPIAVLIGTIYTLSRMAQSSEYTILRTGGLGPARRCRCSRCSGWCSAC